MDKTTDKQNKFIESIEDSFKSRQPANNAGWLNQIRNDAIARFKKNGLPTVKDEEWKYTNVAPITEHRFGLAQKSALKETNEFNRYTKGDENLFVFVNGIYSKELSRLKLEKGLTVIRLKEALQSNAKDIEGLFGKLKEERSDSFIALNDAFLDEGCFIKVDNNAAIKNLVHICHVTSASNGEALVLPRTVILMGRSSEATVLLSHVAFNDDITYFANALTDIYLDENASLHFCKAQKESLNAFHIDNTRVWIERNANLNGFSFMSGSALTRNNLDIIINGEGANATLNGLYSIFGKMHSDNHTSVDHRYPNCTSNQLYKGILNEDSRAVFNGKIFVKPIAQKTNSYQLNKNLLIGKSCRVDTKPQLEIFADDVKCTHGATIGQLNEDEMFYLQSRCISRRDAIRLLSKGFVDDIVNTVNNENINTKLHILLEPSFSRF